MCETLKSHNIYNYNGNKIISEPLQNGEIKIISIISNRKFFINDYYTSFETYDVIVIEEFNNEHGIYDNVCYKFDFIWNNINNTYFLNDVDNNNFETNIIGNINSETSTKEKNTYFLKGDRFISYVFDNPLTFKKLIDDCF
jgi:hypothetical protein|tara:strand:+ start:442 stop:864 length:423 start_codon:yes stop_codon:yes gene_type:complete